MVDNTVKFLEKKKSEDGPWLRKVSHIGAECGIDNMQDKLTTLTQDVREPFLSALIENI